MHSAHYMHWPQLLWRRARRHWLLKMTGTLVGIGVFFALYFWIMDMTAPRATQVPMTVLDDWIGVNQWAVIPYGSLWVYVSLAPALAADVDALLDYLAGAAAIVGLAFLVYLAFPTVTPSVDINWTALPWLQFLKSTDAGGNAFPSLHVAFALYTAHVMSKQLHSVRAPLWPRGLNWCWCGIIVYSTLATRQHVVLDLVGGVATCILAVVLIKRIPWPRHRANYLRHAAG